jgi:hypothetical protein
MDDKDRTIRIQQNMLQQYEKEKSKSADLSPVQEAKNIEMATCATQTDRVSLIDSFAESQALTFAPFYF